jgi:hypothetical protein
MRRRHWIAPVISLTLLVVSGQINWAADVLDNVPDRAVGLLVVRHLAATDAKVQRLLASVRADIPGPLSLLQLATGIDKGLDKEGDLLLLALPNDLDRQQLEFCVWLPVSDYAQLLTSLGGNPVEGITSVTIAGEDLLIARRSSWALLMDPDQRNQMEHLLLPEPSRRDRRSSAWEDWVRTSDVAIVLLPGGVSEIWRMSFSAVAREQRDAPISTDEEAEVLFGRTGTGNLPPAAGGDADDMISKLQKSIIRWRTYAPKFSSWTMRLGAIVCGLRIDADDHAHIEVRTSWSHGATPLDLAVKNDAERRGAGLGLPASMADDGEFIFQSAGTWPSALTAAAASSYVRFLVEDLKTQERIRFPERMLVRLRSAVEKAAAEVTSAAVLTLPGDKQEGVYTNRFAAVRVESANKFVELVGEAMRLWNQMNRDAEGGPRLVFDVADVPVGGSTAVQYSLDLAAADNAPALPEIRQAMEKLFGPGGKLTLFLAKVDDRTALLAAATPDQLAMMLDRLDRKRPIDWTAPQLAAANHLLPDEAAWRAFFSPHGYTTWAARQMDAIVGAPVIGGPLVKEFPATPPIGVAGGIRGEELWLDIAVPLETIRGAAEYLQKTRRQRR